MNSFNHSLFKKSRMLFQQFSQNFVQPQLLQTDKK
jgi:hypothetical protein